MENSGSNWGARREVVQRAGMAINKFLETITDFGLTNGKIFAQVGFDEFNLDVELNYEGVFGKYGEG